MPLSSCGDGRLALSSDYEGSAFSGVRFSLSTTRQSSASDAGSIFRIMLLRCDQFQIVRRKADRLA
jgi:hypothetical protein